MFALQISPIDRLRAFFGAASSPTILPTGSVPQPLAPALPALVLVSAEEREQAAVWVQQLLASAPRAQAIGVISCATGLVLAHGGISTVTAPVSMAMQFGRIAKRAGTMALAVAGPHEPLTELVFSSSPLMHLLRPVAAGQYWLYLAFDAQDINMAIARTLLETVAAPLVVADAPSAALAA